MCCFSFQIWIFSNISSLHPPVCHFQASAAVLLVCNLTGSAMCVCVCVRTGVSVFSVQRETYQTVRGTKVPRLLPSRSQHPCGAAKSVLSREATAAKRPANMVRAYTHTHTHVHKHRSFCFYLCDDSQRHNAFHRALPYTH